MTGFRVNRGAAAKTGMFMLAAVLTTLMFAFHTERASALTAFDQSYILVGSTPLAIPPGVVKVNVELIGGRGATGSALSGPGARMWSGVGSAVTGWVPVTGAFLFVRVGANPSGPTSPDGSSGQGRVVAGTGIISGAGGGATWVADESGYLAVAGGGGGGGGSSTAIPNQTVSSTFYHGVVGEVPSDGLGGAAGAGGEITPLTARMTNGLPGDAGTETTPPPGLPGTGGTGGAPVTTSIPISSSTIYSGPGGGGGGGYGGGGGGGSGGIQTTYNATLQIVTGVQSAGMGARGASGGSLVPAGGSYNLYSPNNLDSRARVRWTIPNTLIGQGAGADFVSPAPVVIPVVGTEAGTNECSLDFEPFVPCGSPVVYDSLSPGFYTLEVRRVNNQGNFDPTPAVHEFTVSLPPPPPPPAPELEVSVRKATVSAKAGKTVRITVYTANVGNEDANSVLVCARFPKGKGRIVGAKCQPTDVIAWGSGKIGFTFNVKLKKKAKGSGPLVFTASESTGAEPVTATTKVKIRKAKKKS